MLLGMVAEGEIVGTIEETQVLCAKATLLEFPDRSSKARSNDGAFLGDGYRSRSISSFLCRSGNKVIVTASKLCKLLWVREKK